MLIVAKWVVVAVGVTGTLLLATLAFRINSRGDVRTSGKVSRGASYAFVLGGGGSISSEDYAKSREELGLKRFLDVVREQGRYAHLVGLVDKVPAGPTRDFALMAELEELTEDVAFMPTPSHEFGTTDGLQKYTVMLELINRIENQSLRGAYLARHAQRQENFEKSFPDDYLPTANQLAIRAEKEVLAPLTGRAVTTESFLSWPAIVGIIVACCGFALTAVFAGFFGGLGELVVEKAMARVQARNAMRPEQSLVGPDKAA